MLGYGRRYVTARQFFDESHLRQPHGGFSLLPTRAKHDILCQPKRKGITE